MSNSPARETDDVEVGMSLTDNSPPPTHGESNRVELELPPPYSTAAARGAPPSYSSLYGDMQTAKGESKNPFDYMLKVWKLILRLACVTKFMIVVLTVPLAMIIIGSVFFNDCPTDRIIPIVLIVLGAAYITKTFMDLRSRLEVRNEDEVGAIRRKDLAQKIASVILGLFILAFFIAGNYIVFSIYNVVVMDDAESPNYCNPILYNFAFWIMIVIYIVGTLLCCCVCCVAGVASWRADD
ncbi:transmembrane protein 272-like isoform X1 [Lytechinus pictus]|uniref:transmembrane protein 272-like isoform X1 n=2 Tax=Lytechinus pictus TaxID=7653 RepID=UPI0030B9FF9E